MKLTALTTGATAEARLVVVFLHGHAMAPEDFAPFAPSLGVPAAFHFVRGPCELANGGHAWWPREPWHANQRSDPPWDLADEHPPERERSRAALAEYLRDVAAQRGDRPLLLVGFSQGGMLACDMLLHEDVKVDALALLSSCRIAFDDWKPRLNRLAGLPTLVSHGTHDDRLAFAAGVGLRDALQHGGAQVDWVPFDGGHEVPLLVWRRLRGFMQGLIDPESSLSG